MTSLEWLYQLNKVMIPFTTSLVRYSTIAIAVLQYVFGGKAMGFKISAIDCRWLCQRQMR